MDKPDVSYARRLGVWDSAMMVVGGVIGAGIFLNPAIVAQRTDSETGLLGAWAFGGVIAFIGALCYAELGARRPEAGGGYVYLREAFSPVVAFLFGWIMWVVNYSSSIAAVAMTFASYACKAIGIAPTLTKPLAVGAIVLLTGINILGIRAGAIVQNIVTVLKLVAVVAVVVAGLAIALPAPPDAMIAPTHHGFGAFGAALLPVLFAYGGWSYINNIAGEVTAPQRNIPRAIAFGMLLVTACYLLANFAYERTLGHAGLAASTAPAAAVMEAAFGPIGGLLIALGIAISTLGFCNVSIIGGARMFQVMGADGLFFDAAARLHPRFRTPHLALMALSGWSIVLLVLPGNKYADLLDYGTLGDWLGYAMVVATLVYYRRSGEATSFRVPGYPWLPALFIIAVLGVLVGHTLSAPRNAAISLGLILAGLPVYWLKRRFNARAAALGP